MSNPIINVSQTYFEKLLVSLLVYLDALSVPKCLLYSALLSHPRVVNSYRFTLKRSNLHLFGSVTNSVISYLLNCKFESCSEPNLGRVVCLLRL